MKRLFVYIDGFNLYFSLLEKSYFDCKWLDIQLFAENIKNSTHSLQCVKYFTSRLSNNSEKQKRQSNYLDALGTTNIEIIYGQFRNQLSKCTTCGNNFYDSKEKMTDVNIATHLISDAFKDNFDVAIIVSADSDLVPPIKMIRSLMPQKEIWVALPPGRESNELRNNASGSFKIGYKKLINSQLPEIVLTKYGQLLTRPDSWV
jgi:uncharacterized LabA/DUF88 family protein